MQSFPLQIQCFTSLENTMAAFSNSTHSSNSSSNANVEPSDPVTTVNPWAMEANSARVAFPSPSLSANRILWKTKMKHNSIAVGLYQFCKNRLTLLWLRSHLHHWVLLSCSLARWSVRKHLYYITSWFSMQELTVPLVLKMCSTKRSDLSGNWNCIVIISVSLMLHD